MLNALRPRLYWGRIQLVEKSATIQRIHACYHLPVNTMGKEETKPEAFVHYAIQYGFNFLEKFYTERDSILPLAESPEF